MRKANFIMLAAATIYLLAVPLALGQGGNPPASPKEKGATSGKGMTAVEQTPKGQGSVEEQIKTLHEQGRLAALKGDSSFAEKYLADDYIGVGGNGQLRTKAEVIQMFKSASLKYEAINKRVLRIRTYGDTAVVNTEAAVKLRFSGKPPSHLRMGEAEGQVEGSRVSVNADSTSEPVTLFVWRIKLTQCRQNAPMQGK